MTTPTGHEVFFDHDENIVSKTDLKGHITYANETFLSIAGYTEAEVIGQPHNMIRHPDMPRCVFKLLWDTLQNESEIFAYVMNITKNGDHYWVIAHVTPSRDTQGNIVGYHSTRRVPNHDTIKKIIIPLYRDLKSIEDSAPNRKEGMVKAYDKLVEILNEKSMPYDEFISSLMRAA